MNQKQDRNTGDPVVGVLELEDKDVTDSFSDNILFTSSVIDHSLSLKKDLR